MVTITTPLPAGLPEGLRSTYRATRALLWISAVLGVLTLATTAFLIPLAFTSAGGIGGSVGLLVADVRHRRNIRRMARELGIEGF